MVNIRDNRPIRKLKRGRPRKHTDLAGLELRLRRYAFRSKKHVSEVSRRFGIIFLQELAINTPIDTGKAVVNWRVAPNAKGPPTDTLPAPKNVGEAIREVVTNGEALLNKLKDNPRNSGFHIFNNTLYIRELNDGHSSQAPANFIQIARERAVKVANSKSREIFERAYYGN